MATTTQSRHFVRCIDASGGTVGLLTEGKVYEVEGFHSPYYIKLVGCDYLFKTCRFKMNETK